MLMLTSDEFRVFSKSSITYVLDDDIVVINNGETIFKGTCLYDNLSIMNLNSFDLNANVKVPPCFVRDKNSALKKFK
ncbi:hypothetical protein Ancab_004544, partial [Ancistrocladus abbreviatus]